MKYCIKLVFTKTSVVKKRYEIETGMPKDELKQFIQKAYDIPYDIEVLFEDTEELPKNLKLEYFVYLKEGGKEKMIRL